MKVVTYYRISKKGTGLGLESQYDYCQSAISSNGWDEVGSFTDDGLSGALSIELRTGLQAALKECEKQGACLLVAKVDRLSRDVEHTAAIMKRVCIKVATMPHADNFQIHLFAALAQQEREFIAQRTKAALSKLQDRADRGDIESQAKLSRRNGTVMKVRHLGTEKSSQIRQQTSKAYMLKVEDAVHAARAKGHTSLRQLATYMNERGIKTLQGKQWTVSTAQRIIAQMDRAISG
jgi:DNA invertase Pin-like site-specific DNA recombinase